MPHAMATILFEILKIIVESNICKKVNKVYIPRKFKKSFSVKFLRLIKVWLKALYKLIRTIYTTAPKNSMSMIFMINECHNPNISIFAAAGTLPSVMPRIDDTEKTFFSQKRYNML